MKLSDAISIAVEAHKNQKDKAGMPYILHPMTVMNNVDTEDEKVVAVLHDVVEDTDITLDMLISKGLSKEQAEALFLLTKPEDITYMDYIIRLSKNHIAKRVKIEDLYHNLDFSRLPDDYDTSYIKKKYEKALNYLMSENLNS